MRISKQIALYAGLIVGLCLSCKSWNSRNHVDKPAVVLSVLFSKSYDSGCFLYGITNDDSVRIYFLNSFSRQMVDTTIKIPQDSITRYRFLIDSIPPILFDTTFKTLTVPTIAVEQTLTITYIVNNDTIQRTAPVSKWVVNDTTINHPPEVKKYFETILMRDREFENIVQTYKLQIQNLDD